ncbi:MAG: hypothetical protein RDV41_12430 [Planctomycetota bacterium]|nr:hypothetical protein [Planctomycetota bacterium]
MASTRIVLVATSLATALLVFAAPLGAQAPQTQTDERTKAIEQLREEINLVNFVNGLNLSEDQLKKLIAISGEVQTRKDSEYAKLQSLLTDTERAFAELKANLLAKGPNVPQDIEGKASRLNDRLKELRVKMDEEYEGYAKKVCALLTDAQKDVISTFKPCLTPPKNQKNPVLVGQSDGNDIAMKILRGIREMPDKVFQKQREMILERQFDKIKKGHGTELSEAEKTAERERVYKLLDEIRTMDDKKFELDKDRLATELKVKDRAEDLHEELKSLTKERDPEVAEKSTARYFLSPVIVPILEDRLKNLESYRQASQVDLDATTPTDRPT